jgi:hypothetical protein
MELQKKGRGGIEERKSPRRTLQYPAKIDGRDGTPLHECVLFDVSQTGAKVIVQVANDIPDEFILLLGKTYRKCRVVWKKDRQMGVRFVPHA